MPKEAQSITITTAAIPGMFTAVGSGVASGVAQSVANVNKASLVLSEHSGQRDSLLRSLQILFDDQHQMDHSVLETYLP